MLHIQSIYIKYNITVVSFLENVMMIIDFQYLYIAIFINGCNVTFLEIQLDIMPQSSQIHLCIVVQLVTSF